MRRNLLSLLTGATFLALVAGACAQPSPRVPPVGVSGGGASGSTTINTVSCPLNGSCTISAAASLVNGSTTITSGTTGNILFDNGGILGEKAVTGSGSAVLATAPSVSSLTVTTAFTATGLVTNADLVNSSLTIGSTAVSLGGTASTISGLTLASPTVTGAFTATGLVTNADLANNAITIGGNLTALGGTVTQTTMLDSIGNVQGDVLYRGATTWSILAPGTAGNCLQTGGAAANPSWGACGSGAGNVVISPATGNVSGDCVQLSNTTTGVTDAGFPCAAPSTQLAKSTSFTLTAQQWAVQDPVLATATLTETFPATSTLNINGIQFLQNGGNNTLTIQPNAADQVCLTGSGSCLAAGTSTPLTAGFGAWISTNAAGKLFVSPFPFSAGASGLTVGTTTISGGTNGDVEYNNSGVLGELTPSALIDTIGSAQGDILYRGASTWSVLTPGTSGNCLQTQGAAANPIWASCGGGGGGQAPVKYVTGNWYQAINGGTLSISGYTQSNNTITWVPWMVFSTISVTQVGAAVAATDASGNVQFAIYASNASGLPTGSALCSTSNISVASFGNIAGTCSAASLSAGLYWIGMNTNSTTMNLAWLQNNITSPAFTAGASTQAAISNGSSAVTTITTSTQTFGTWPTNPTVSQAVANGLWAPMYKL